MTRRIAASFTALLWDVFTYIGYYLVFGAAQRHVPSYPSAEQWRYYVQFPLIMLLVSVGLFLLARRIPAPLFIAIWLLQVLLFFLFFLRYSGGV